MGTNFVYLIMVKKFADIGKATDDFASIADTAGFNFETKLKGGGWETGYKTKGGEIKAKYSTKLFDFPCSIEDKLKGNKLKSTISVNVPSSYILDGKATVDYVLNATQGKAATGATVNVDYEPCPWIRANAEFGLGNGNIAADIATEYSDFVVGAATTFNGGKMGAVKLAAEGEVSKDVFAVGKFAPSANFSSCAVDVEVKTPYDNGEYQVGVSIPDVMAFSVDKVAVTAVGKVKVDGNTNLIAKCSTSDKQTDGAFNTVQVGSEITTGGATATTFIQFGLSQNAAVYKSMGFNLAYKF